MNANIKLNKELAKSAKTDGTRKIYQQEAATWQEFKADMTSQYRKNAKTEIKASNIITSKYSFDAIKNFNQWKRLKGKK